MLDSDIVRNLDWHGQGVNRPHPSKKDDKKKMMMGGMSKKKMMGGGKMAMKYSMGGTVTKPN